MNITLEQPVLGCDELMGAAVSNAEMAWTLIRQRADKLRPAVRRARAVKKLKGMKKYMKEIRTQRDRGERFLEKTVRPMDKTFKADALVRGQINRLKGYIGILTAWIKKAKKVIAKSKAPTFQADEAGNIIGAFGLLWNPDRLQSAAEGGKITEAQFQSAVSGKMDEDAARELHRAVHGAGILGAIVPLAVVAAGAYLVFGGAA